MRDFGNSRISTGRMTMRNVLLSSVLPVALLGAAGAHAQEVAPQEELQPALSDIIVTASKRPERLDDVPGAISAIGSDTIDEIGITQFSDYMTYVPGLSLLAGSSPGFGQTVVRGLSTGIGALSTTVGYYVDETPFSASGSLSAAAIVTPDPDLSDVERIEVLKGPQGTLYGASTLGGLIRIVSKRPDLHETSGFARLEGSDVDGGAAGYSVRGSVSVPIVDGKVAMRVAGYRRSDGGFIDNVKSGQNNVNGTVVTGGRLNLRVVPTEPLEFQFNVLVQKTKSRGESYVKLDPVTLRPIAGDLTTNVNFATPSETLYRVFNFNTNLDLGGVQLVNSTSYGIVKAAQLTDYTANYGIFLPANPDYGVYFTADPESRKLSNEFRLVSDANGKFEWMGGLFYTHEKNRYVNHITGVSLSRGSVLPGTLGNVYTSILNSNYEEFAAFANATYYFTETFDLGLGARWSTNEQSFRGPTSGLIARVPYRQNESEDSAWTYLATLRWRPTEDISTYIRAARGYRPGGPQTSPTVLANPNAPKTYDPDWVWNYEIGAKASFFDKKLHVDAALYYIDWTDIQLNALVGGILVLGNAGKAESKGAELEFRYDSQSGLRLGGYVSYNETSILTDAPSVGARTGDPLILAPRWGASATADYDFDLGGSLAASVGASYRYVGTRYSGFSGDLIGKQIRIPDYQTVDLRALLSVGSNYDLALRVDNLFDKRGYSSITNVRVTATQNIPLNGAVIRPRTFEISGTVRF